MCYWCFLCAGSTESVTIQAEAGVAQTKAIHVFDIIGSIHNVLLPTPVIIHASWKDSFQGAMGTTFKPGCLAARRED